MLCRIPRLASNATSVPGSRQPATSGSPIATKPRVSGLRNRVETSSSPNACRTVCYKVEAVVAHDQWLPVAANSREVILRSKCERSAWVRDFPDVSRSSLDASGIHDRWKQAMCVFDPALIAIAYDFKGMAALILTASAARCLVLSLGADMRRPVPVLLSAHEKIQLIHAVDRTSLGNLRTAHARQRREHINDVDNFVADSTSRHFARPADDERLRSERSIAVRSSGQIPSVTRCPTWD